MARKLHADSDTEHLTDDTLIESEVTESVLEEFERLRGTAVIEVEVDSASTGLDDEDEPLDDAERIHFDAELYLVDRTLLSLYGATLSTSVDDPPIKGLDAIDEALSELAEEEDVLRRVFQDDSGALALEFGSKAKRRLVIRAESWTLSRWDDLPDEEEDFDEDDWDDLDDEDDLDDDWDDDDYDSY